MVRVRSRVLSGEGCTTQPPPNMELTSRPVREKGNVEPGHVLLEQIYTDQQTICPLSNIHQPSSSNQVFFWLRLGE